MRLTTRGYKVPEDSNPLEESLPFLQFNLDKINQEQTEQDGAIEALQTGLAGVTQIVENSLFEVTVEGYLVPSDSGIADTKFELNESGYIVPKE